MNELPVISLQGLRSPDLTERQATAAELGRACRDIGFFYVSDHGIPAEAIDSMCMHTAPHGLVTLELASKTNSVATRSASSY